MNNQNGRTPIIAIILTLGFSAIVFYILFGILMLADRPGGTARIVFSSINCLLLIGLASQGGTIRRFTNTATLIQLWSVTSLYTIVQFVSVFMGVSTWYGKGYVLFQLIALFVYLCVALPVLSISYKRNNNQ